VILASGSVLVPLAGGFVICLLTFEVGAILHTFFEGYISDVIYVAPLLAYAFVRGDNFVEAFRGIAMPCPRSIEVWQDFDFAAFHEDGLSVVRPSKA
jgi:hypothetical protein